MDGPPACHFDGLSAIFKVTAFLVQGGEGVPQVPWQYFNNTSKSAIPGVRCCSQRCAQCMDMHWHFHAALRSL